MNPSITENQGIGQENPRVRELSQCRRRQGDLDKEMTVLQYQIGGILSNKGVIEARQRTLTIDLNLLMQKINAEGYHNRHLYSVDEGNYRRDIAQTKDEVRMIESQAEPMQRRLRDLQKELKLEKKKEKRILVELKTGMTVGRDSETGTDNPIAPALQWVFNILGQNAMPKFIGLIIILAMIFYSIVT
jgi:chromosome segregation ATPase